MELSARIAHPHLADDGDLVEAFSSMIQDPRFPCLGARSVLRRDRATLHVYDGLGTRASAQRLLPHLREFAGSVDLSAGFASFVALFRGPRIRDEAHFEDLLWRQLRILHSLDGEPWAAGVSADPADPHFAFSVGGSPFFVVGLHPQASRDARRAPVPTLVFNLHEQFEELRASGGYGRMRDRIRARDTRLQGDANPMMCDHGEASEARQYSGRAVDALWQPDFPTPDGPEPGRAQEDPT